MSQENVEIIRQAYRPGDPSGFFELLHKGVQVDVSKMPLLPDHPELLGGKEAALDLYRDYWGTWDRYVLEPAEILDAGDDRVLVIQDERGVGRGSGAPFERRWAVLYTLREEKIVRIEHFSERRQALEAAGLSELAMSKENVEVVRAFIDALNRGDMDAAFKDAAPNVEYDASRAVGPWHGVYRGLDEVRRLAEEFVEGWDSVRLEPDEFIEVGEHVVVPWTMQGTGRYGIELQARTTWVWTVRDGLIVRICLYQEREEALEAAGLSE